MLSEDLDNSQTATISAVWKGFYAISDKNHKASNGSGIVVLMKGISRIDSIVGNYNRQIGDYVLLAVDSWRSSLP